jgi:hypothetical protein
VTFELPHYLSLDCVVNEGVALTGADCQVVASAFTPANASDLFVVGHTAQPLDLRGVGTPHVDRVVEPYCQHVLLAPVQQVQVEVILQIRGI